jgi:hypothetical protein
MYTVVLSTRYVSVSMVRKYLSSLSFGEPFEIEVSSLDRLPLGIVLNPQ